MFFVGIFVMFLCVLNRAPDRDGRGVQGAAGAEDRQAGGIRRGVRDGGQRALGVEFKAAESDLFAGGRQRETTGRSECLRTIFC